MYLRRGPAPIIDLRPARDARLDILASWVECDEAPIFVVVRKGMWTRTHERHLAPKDVEELGQLVDAEPAQYPADTGNARIARLRIDSGTPGADLPVLEPMPVHRLMDGAVLEDVVSAGVLVQPSGVAFTSDKLVVTDHATSKLWWFDRTGAVLGSLDTGLPEGSLAGVALGPDGKVYLSDMKLGVAYRVEAR